MNAIRTFPLLLVQALDWEASNLFRDGWLRISAIGLRIGPAKTLVLHSIRNFLGDLPAEIPFDDMKGEIDAAGEPTGAGEVAIIDAPRPANDGHVGCCVARTS